MKKADILSSYRENNFLPIYLIKSKIIIIENKSVKKDYIISKSYQTKFYQKRKYYKPMIIY
jgi:hypothetical protein